MLETGNELAHVGEMLSGPVFDAMRLREEAHVAKCLQEAAEEVLETMFFLTVDREVEWEEVSGKEHHYAEMDFQGAAEGRLELAVSEDLAPVLASGFFGKDESELTPAEIAAVICELANMLCGSVLSRLESGSLFQLGAPQMMATDLEGESQISAGHKRVFDLGSGDVKVCFWMWREHEAPPAQ
ncbi:MAG: chemotaxis protein CheX [Acidobacteriota bacterium]